MELTFRGKRWLLTGQRLRTAFIWIFSAIFAMTAAFPAVFWHLFPEKHSAVLTSVPVFVTVLTGDCLLFFIVMKRLKEL
jgi:hypothetical protein